MFYTLKKISFICVLTFFSCSNRNLVYHLHYYPANLGCLRVLTLYKNLNYRIKEYHLYPQKKIKKTIIGKYQIKESKIILDDSIYLNKIDLDKLEVPGWRSYVLKQNCNCKIRD